MVQECSVDIIAVWVYTSVAQWREAMSDKAEVPMAVLVIITTMIIMTMLSNLNTLWS
jgi:hypothetical protein